MNVLDPLTVDSRKLSSMVRFLFLIPAFIFISINALPMEIDEYLETQRIMAASGTQSHNVPELKTTVNIRFGPSKQISSMVSSPLASKDNILKDPIKISE